MRKFGFVLILISSVFFCSCSSGNSNDLKAIMSQTETECVFDMGDKLKAVKYEAEDKGVSAENGDVTFRYVGAVFYGGFLYIPYEIYGCKDKNPPQFDIEAVDAAARQGPYFVDVDSYEDNIVKGSIYFPILDLGESVTLRVQNFKDGDKEIPGCWDLKIEPEIAEADVLTFTASNGESVNVFNGKLAVKNIILTDFFIRIECDVKEENDLTHEEIMQLITSSEATGSSKYYDSYIQVLYKDGTVSPKYEYCMTDESVLWSWFLENGQIDAKNVKALYIGDCEFIR